MMEILNIQKTDTVYIVNGILLTCLFFGVRIFTIPFQFHWYRIRHYRHESRDCLTLGSLYYMAVSFGLLSDTLNVIWARKLFLGATKVLKSRFSGSMSTNSRSDNDHDTLQHRNMHSLTQVKLKEN